MEAILHAPGFLGTSGNFAADMTLVISIFVALLFTFGAWLALKGQYTWHGRVQTTGAVINLIMVLWMMVLPFRDYIVRDAAAPQPAIFYLITIVHAITGFSALIFGNFVVLRGHNLMIPALKFNKYKPFMRMAYGLYMAATLLGICVYFIWFVYSPNPPAFK